MADAEPEQQVSGLTRPRSLWALLHAAARQYRRFPILFLTLALCVIGPWDLVLLAVTGDGPLHRGGENPGARWLIDIVRVALITPLIAALHMHAVATIGRGEQPRLSAVARQGLRALPVVAAASIISWIGITIGSLLIVPGFLLALRWAVVAQVAAVEAVDWKGALSRSRALTRERYVHVFGVSLVAGLISVAIDLLARAVSVHGEAAPTVALGIAADTLTASFAALILALLYFDLLARSGAPARPREHEELRDLD